MATAKDVEQLRRAIERAGGIVLPADIGRVLGFSAQRAHQVMRLDGFPEPIAETTDGRPVWARAQIDEWAAARPRKGS